MVSLTALSLYHRGKSFRPIGVLCDRNTSLGIEAQFLRGLGNLPVTTPIVLFRIFFTDEYKNVIDSIVDLINILS